MSPNAPTIPSQTGAALDYDAVALVFADLAVRAGAAVMAVYAGDPHARLKADASPVCDADEQAEAIILDGLRARLPGIAVLAEEAASRGEGFCVAPLMILVDPLDGTREFLSRNGEFTVNVALIADGVARAGAIYAPAQARLWFAGATAYVCDVEPGALLPASPLWRTIRARPAPHAGLVALASRSHSDPQTEAFLARHHVSARRNAGSSLKFCLLAEGAADVYPRFCTTMEWDIAAGDAILRAAGGVVLGEDGAPMPYGKTADGYRNAGFVAWGDPQAAAAPPLADQFIIR